MSNVYNGGPAFPVNDVMALEPRTTAEMVSLAHGMSLRDWFAGNALSGICASGTGKSWSKQMLAEEAYHLADAMLKEREK